MFDFRLKVFYTVAKRLNFTKAAQELFISQPAVSKHIKEIEKHFQCTLFERSGNKLMLTPQGEILMKYASEILRLHKELEADLSISTEDHRGLLRIGSSTTAAQYVIPKYLASFRKAYPHIRLELMTGNTEKVETLLVQNELDFGIVEGKSKRSGLNYTPAIKDEIVLCCHINTPVASVLQIEELSPLPFVVREEGSGTLEIIRSSLFDKGIKLSDLKLEMILENNESIKNYIKYSSAFAFISISAITEELKAKQMKIIDVEGLNLERYYYLVSRQGEQTTTASLFINQFLNYNF